MNSFLLSVCSSAHVLATGVGWFRCIALFLRHVSARDWSNGLIVHVAPLSGVLPSPIYRDHFCSNLERLESGNLKKAYCSQHTRFQERQRRKNGNLTQ